MDNLTSKLFALLIILISTGCGGSNSNDQNNQTKISLLPLPDIAVVRGAQDITAICIESTKLISFEYISFNVYSGSEYASSLEIAELKFYRDELISENILSSAPGTYISEGKITSFSYTALSDHHCLALTFVDTDPSNISPIQVTISSYSAIDEGGSSIQYPLDENNDEVRNSELFSSREIIVTDSGFLTLTEDVNNEDNENSKTILAGSSETVFSVDIQSINESMDVETVVFTVDTDLTSAITNASLYLDDTLVDTNSNLDIAATAITFDNLDALIIEEVTSELKLALNTEAIGYQKVGQTLQNVKVSGISIKKGNMEGIDSGKDAPVDIDLTNITSSKAFSIVSATINVWVNTSLDSSNTTEINVSLNTGDNTSSSSNASVEVQVSTLTFSTAGSNYDSEYELFSGSDTTNVITNSAIDGVLSFDIISLNSILQSAEFETFGIRAVSPQEGDIVSLTLLSNGITYDVLNVDNSSGIVMQNAANLPLGERTY